MKITIQNIEKKTFTNNIQLGFKIYKTNNLIWNWRNQLANSNDIEKWIVEWGNNKIITALIYLIKQDEFYGNENDDKTILTLALDYSVLSKKLQTLFLSHLPFYKEDDKSIKKLLEFIK